MPGFIITVTRPARVRDTHTGRVGDLVAGSSAPPVTDNERCVEWDDGGREVIAADRLQAEEISRQTVDTLAYAIDHVAEPAANDLAVAHLASLEVAPDDSLSLTERIAAQQPRVDAEAAWRRADAELRELPESGGTIPLPDGSTITVEPAAPEPPCFEDGRCVGHEAYRGAGTRGLRYCDEPAGEAGER